ncbi:MDR family MFS transporter [Staphylococcus xylosus]|jgi:DHA2 family lincomycin resistance protein-like MFS transporter|uniref:DHA2 family efflux MFS transporter permease subunit n=3 Tax=Staphylococcus TaxID=1279 RepID=A0A1W7M1Y2_STAXY|nr:MULTISPECIES: MDR family MFS transporter [Staphylococcaceae]MDW3956047.1 MDR family MFS transporter [Staphylococcus saprophyticus]NKR45560.1 DHA2 family efflux MFS transporter permease subunit [Prescottella equi]HCV7682783.1 multidrug efflux MFS transporter [Staphylococcus aureus]MBO3066573.1 multidrug efflux MFS transporter [Staphylococcus shinii]MDW4345225.1 MDR family MFS transporter [Staphylococcus saprophyticus]
MNNNKHQKYEYLADDPNFKTLPIILSLIIGAFFAILNETLLNIALTSLMKEFDITLPTVQWMTTGFMLIMGIVAPISALLLQWFTTRQLFLSTMTIFTLGTVICAAAPAFPILLIGRFIQAIGTGMLLPIIFNVFLLIYPPFKRGKIMGIVGFVIMFAPTIGPTLSGVIVEYLGWRSLFIMVIPFSIFSIAFASKFLINVSEVTKPKIDYLSLVFSTIGFGAVIYGFSSAGKSESGFLSINVLIPIIVGIIGIVLFSIRQLNLKEPLIDLRVFKYPMYTHAILMFLIIIMTMFASEIILPIYMQGPLALTAATAGLILLPGSLLNGAMSPFMGYLFDKFGPRVLMIPASIVLSGAMYVMSRLNVDTPLWIVILSYILLMLSVSAIMMPAETNGLNQLPKHLYPHGTAVMTTLQPVAGAIGVAVFVSIMNARQLQFLQNSGKPQDPDTINQAMVAGVELVYFISFSISIIAVILSFIVYRATPKKTD